MASSPTSSPPKESSVPAFVERLVDDAGLFPPEELTMLRALARHRHDSIDRHPVLTGAFVLQASRLREMQYLLAEEDHITVSLIGSPAELGMESLTATLDDPRITLASLEIPPPLASDPPRVPGDLTRIAEQIRSTNPHLPVHVELAWGPSFERAAAELADIGVAAKIRCGGIHRSLFPATSDVADALVSLATHTLPFKATAGLHHAIGYTDPSTGFSHHGFVNLLLALARAVAGESRSAVAQALTLREPARVTDEVSSLDLDLRTTVRTLFTSFGCCSPQEPIDDLTSLGLVDTP